MPKFRKKPVIIDAFQWTGLDCKIPDWFAGEAQCFATEKIENSEYLIIPTLEGGMRADINDFIIKGIMNEMYPCKPDIFAATYEPVNA